MSNSNPELRRAYNQAYWEAHREALIPKNKARRIEILEERRAKDRAYNAAHRDKRKAHREQNKERSAAYHKAHYRENRERILARARELASDPNRKAKRAAQAKARRLAHPEEYEARWRKYESEHRDEVRRRTKEWYEKNKDHARARRYGLTFSEYQAMLEKQGGVCAICGESKWKRCANIDHDHITGKVRGLLCGDCNRAIGLIRDNPKTALEMARYLTDQARTMEVKL